MKLNINKVEATKRLAVIQEEVNELKKIIEADDSLKVEELTYPNSCKLLNKCIRTRDHYETDREWAQHQLERMIDAANFIDNDNKVYVHDFKNSSISKHLPYFRKDSGSWSLRDVIAYYWASPAPLGLYYKTEKSARIIVGKYMDLYSIILG